MFDLLKLRGRQAVDSQGGFNVHTIALRIPVEELGGDQQIVGVYATTSRRRVTILGPGSDDRSSATSCRSRARATRSSTRASSRSRTRTCTAAPRPRSDATLFRKYALTPELAALINALVFGSNVGADDEPHRHRRDLHPRPDQGRSLDRCRRGSPAAAPTIRPIPTTPGFSRLSIFGGDTLTSSVQAGFGNGTVPGRMAERPPVRRRRARHRRDRAHQRSAREPAEIVGPAGDNVDSNDIAYNKVFPYAATPLNGRTHTH